MDRHGSLYSVAAVTEYRRDRRLTFAVVSTGVALLLTVATITVAILTAGGAL